MADISKEAPLSSSQEISLHNTEQHVPRDAQGNIPKNSTLQMTFLSVPVSAAPTSSGSNPAKTIDAAAEALKKLGADVVVKVEKSLRGDPFIVVKTERLHDAIQFLRDDAEFLCTSLEVISSVDYAPKEAVAPVEDQPAQPAQEGRIETVYTLASYQFKHQFTVKVYLDRDHARVKSLCDLYRCANWYERECYDMVGVKFEGHPHLTRILLPTDWVGHPLRRDYVFPEEYNGMKVPL